MVRINYPNMTGTVEIPVEEASVADILRYVDLSEFDAHEIAEMTSSSAETIRGTLSKLRRDGYDIKTAAKYKRRDCWNECLS